MRFGGREWAGWEEGGGGKSGKGLGMHWNPHTSFPGGGWGSGLRASDWEGRDALEPLNHFISRWGLGVGLKGEGGRRAAGHWSQA